MTAINFKRPIAATVDQEERVIGGATVGLAAEVAHGSCTDLPPMKSKRRSQPI